MTFCRLEIPAIVVFALSTQVGIAASETAAANPGILLKSSMLRGVALTVTSYLYRKSFRFHTATVTVVLTLISLGDSNKVFVFQSITTLFCASAIAEMHKLSNGTTNLILGILMVGGTLCYRTHDIRCARPSHQGPALTRISNIAT